MVRFFSGSWSIVLRLFLSLRSATLSHGLNLHFYLQHTHTHSLLYHHHCSPFFILPYESCRPLLIIILIHRQDPQYLSRNRQPWNRRLTHSCNSVHMLPVDSLPFPCACCCLYAHFSYLYEPRVHITNRNICNIVNHLHIIIRRNTGEVNIYVAPGKQLWGSATFARAVCRPNFESSRTQEKFLEGVNARVSGSKIHAIEAEHGLPAKGFEPQNIHLAALSGGTVGIKPSSPLVWNEILGFQEIKDLFASANSNVRSKCSSLYNRDVSSISISGINWKTTASG